MLNIQEVVDDLLIPGKFPPPTYCEYYGDFPVSLQHATIGRLFSYARIGWRSNKFQGQNKICGLDLTICKLNIYVNVTPGIFKDSFGRGAHYNVILDEWQKFVSTELPKWFNLANELVPMKLFQGRLDD